MRSRVQHETFSRETFLLGNNVLLIAAMLVVLLGTLLPLVHKQLGLGSISIGEPFFNTMFTVDGAVGAAVGHRASGALAPR